MSDITRATQFGVKFEGVDGVMWFSHLGGLRSACMPGCGEPEYRRPKSVHMRTVVTRVDIEDEGELDQEWIDRLTSPGATS